ncbi:hypothetical protein CROQUDRAFT_719347 [Cronartium quercuum f. sp. fusiforme G11]|uniref:Uncharacterized protein n=1 Tax=Cronartium quercuum f. sp. fusiforme G11 TaxID=708437 RepID=A0A9P6THY8_9BASI|nr:hypothetical protein CROQUDRAFT_719347 [Cronartium quercuum f. sp. fusiforme G11]
MPSSYLFALRLAFILILSMSILPDVHARTLSRRSSLDNHPDPVLFMDNYLVYVNNAVLVYTPTGTVAFQVTKTKLHGIGRTQYRVTDFFGRVILILNSDDDICNYRSHYKDRLGLPKFKFDPRGILPDRWYFTSATDPGVRFVFKRHVLNLGGKIINKQSKKVVATLSIEKRREPWLVALFVTRKTYVLRSDGTLPNSELATLMVLVQIRYHHCGY